MPSLIRFLVFIGILAGIAYGGMLALVLTVKPQTREMTVRVPAERLTLDAPASPAATGTVPAEQ